jgi:hypothetical protein
MQADPTPATSGCNAVVNSGYLLFERLELLDPERYIRLAIGRYPLDAIVDAIAIFEGKRLARTLPEGADARYLLGIVRNVAAKHEGEQIALQVEGEGLQRPALGQTSAPDAILQAPLAEQPVLLSEHARVEVGVARLGLLGTRKLALDHLSHGRHVQVLEQLIDVVADREGSSSSSLLSGKRKNSPAMWRSTRASIRSMSYSPCSRASESA